jgi:murein DD-endopeptidase MepM/ murein hydrolase activator NlpD
VDVGIMTLPSGSLITFPVQYHRHQIASGVLGIDGRHDHIWFGNGFDQGRNHGEDRHDAIDIMGPEGLPVVSPVAGTVPATWRVSGADRPGAGTTGTGDGGFYLVIVDALRGYYHYFAHLQAPPLFGPGASVRPRQQIGYLGATGIAHGNPHLHYQVSIRNRIGALTRFLNPYDELRRLAGPGAETSPTSSTVRIRLSGGGPL